MPVVPQEEVEETATEDQTWAEIGELADGGNTEAMEFLVEAAKQTDTDHEAYDTWTELAEYFQALEDEQNDESLSGVEEDEGTVVNPDPEDEEVEDAAAPRFTVDDFKGKSLGEVRKLAVQSEIKGADKMGRKDLIAALISDESEAEPETPPEPSGRNDYEGPTLNSADIAAIAEAVADVLARRLSH